MQRFLPACFLSIIILVSMAVFFAGETRAEDSYWSGGGGDHYDPGGGGYAPPPSGGHGGGGHHGSLFGASQFSYGYFDAGYYLHAFDAAGVDDTGGFAGAISIPLVDTFFVKAALGFASPEDALGEDVDYLSWNLGGGIGLPIGGWAFDIVIEGGLARRKLDGGDLRDPIDGYGFYVTPWVRWGLGELVELNGGVTFVGVDGDSNVEANFKALLHLTPHVSLFGDVTFGERLNLYGAGLRISF